MDVFNSRDLRFKSPFGAVKQGQAVTLHLRPPRQMGFSGATLYARFESWDNFTAEIPMPWQGCDLGQDDFSATLDTKDYLGLIFYSFRLFGIDGREMEIPMHQLTVYAEETVADWFSDGLCYQIFPDRFCSTHQTSPNGLVGGRTVHESWEEEPVYLPDEKGEIRNRDFFCGTLNGIREKLDYLQFLGVKTIYLCPIFEAAENHRYGTADYYKIDPMLGTNDDFIALCHAAHNCGMRIMLDGVFNHTGYESKYFNATGFYDTVGAYQSEQSEYASWFRFVNWPTEYESWWGIYSLPSVEEQEKSYQSFIFGDKKSVVRHWLSMGADGWRLDVADELPDHFINGIHRAAREEKEDAIIIGEVWEDGSQKIAYDVRRKHILGGHCDGLMNYPLRDAILDFYLHGNGAAFREKMESLQENYPPFAFYNAMNALGTHDTPRILTLLALGSDKKDQSRQWRAQHRLDDAEYALGLRRLLGAYALLFCFPGVPTIYYGDEIGMQGFEDPFNRRPFPWGSEDEAIKTHVCALSALRGGEDVLKKGALSFYRADHGVLSFWRGQENRRLLCLFSSDEEMRHVPLPDGMSFSLLFGGGEIRHTPDDEIEISLSPCGFAVLLAQEEEEHAVSPQSQQEG